MLTNEIVQMEAVRPDGVCFFCDNYVDSVIVHETKVHGRNRLMQNEVY